MAIADYCQGKNTDTANLARKRTTSLLNWRTFIFKNFQEIAKISIQRWIEYSPHC